MHKSWRASDVVIVLMLAVLILISYMQIQSSDRNYDRLEKLISNLEAVPAGAPSRPSETPTATGDEKDKQGDWLVRHLNSEPRTLNPVTSSDYYSQIVHGYLFDTLIDLDPDTLEFKGKLAESWTISEDKLTITFKLRKGMVWSDGVPITTDDIIFSYETITNPKVDAMRTLGYFKDVEHIKALDDLTVEYKFKKPYFKSFEVAGGGYMTIIPRHVYQFTDAEAFNATRDKLVGSGPYVFESWEAGQQIVLKRNPLYYGEPYNFDRIVFRFVPEEMVAYQKCKAQELDWVAMSPEHYVAAGHDADFQAHHQRLQYKTPYNGYSFIGYNQDVELFKDRRVRLALTHLVPRERLKKEVLHDLVDVTSGPFWTGSELVKVPIQADTSIKPWPFDPIKALQLLTEAGWRDTDGDGVLDKNGKPLKFTLMMGQGSQLLLDIGGMTKEEMGKVGVQMELMQLEWSVFEERLNEHKFEVVMLSWGGGSVEGDPYQIWHSDSIANRGSNFISFCNAEADRLIEAARVEFDRTKRNELYHKFHRLLHEEQPYTFLFGRRSLAAVHRRFEGVKIHALGLDDRDWWTPRDMRIYGQ
ncbi:MAG: peptide-binding protein [Planctomycetes bacterium]|nr:peptide-binding protein [Planctomycetota bacterium]